jgi:hypothetical protein
MRLCERRRIRVDTVRALEADKVEEAEEEEVGAQMPKTRAWTELLHL